MEWFSNKCGKLIRSSFGFALLYSVIGETNPAPLSQPGKTNHDLLTVLAFSAHGDSCMYLLLILFGSLDCLCSL